MLCRSLGFGAERFVEGHHPAVSSREEMDALFEKMRLAELAAREGTAIAAPDDDTDYFVQAFAAGLAAT